MKLTRKARTSDGGTRYWHPHGYYIRQLIRDWDARGYRSSAGNPTSKVSWEIRDGFSSRPGPVFDTLREAREWCDSHPTSS